MCLCVASQQKATTSHKPFAADGASKSHYEAKNENQEFLESEWETRKMRWKKNQPRWWRFGKENCEKVFDIFQCYTYAAWDGEAESEASDGGCGAQLCSSDFAIIAFSQLVHLIVHLESLLYPHRRLVLIKLRASRMENFTFECGTWWSGAVRRRSDDR